MQMRAPDISLAFLAIFRSSKTIRKIRMTIRQQPMNPSSSPAMAKMKSVWGSDRKLPFFTEATTLLSSPFPVSCPEPMAIIEFCCWREMSG